MCCAAYVGGSSIARHVSSPYAHLRSTGICVCQHGTSLSTARFDRADAHSSMVSLLGRGLAHSWYKHQTYPAGILETLETISCLFL